MFTGLIETRGNVAHLQKHPGGARLTIRAPQIAANVQLGDSVAVNGCCITVVEHDEHSFTADLVPETLARTNLGVLAIGSEVNLERAMTAGDRFGGHWVQGHIDCLASVRSRKRVGTEDLLELTIPFEIARFIVAQGSITIDGVSLSVVDVAKDRMRVAIIPHTREMTTLGKLEPMDVVNLELDVLAKYVDKHIQAYVARLPKMLREAGVTEAEPNGVHDPGNGRSVPRAKLARPKEPRSRAVTSAATRAVTASGLRPTAERRQVTPAASTKKRPAGRKPSSGQRAKTSTGDGSKRPVARQSTKKAATTVKRATPKAPVRGRKTAASRTKAKAKATTRRAAPARSKTKTTRGRTTASRTRRR